MDANVGGGNGSCLAQVGDGDMEVFRGSNLRTQTGDLRRVRVVLWIELLGPVLKPPISRWASSDLEDQGLKVVIVSPNGGSRVLTFVWLDEEIVHRKCSINGETFMKQWAVG
jgi:hypothetical protein